jgi:antitoxin MazE
MELQVNRWGNSLAVRLPAQLARQMGLEEGSQVLAELTAEGELKLSPRTPLVADPTVQRVVGHAKVLGRYADRQTLG